ncbi:MAG: MYG1 family protein, partial [Nanoarchaeota archaeon]
EYIDKEIIEFIDSIDNGIEMPESKINIYSLQEIIKNLNPFWNENISETEQFNKAVELMQEILKREIKKAESIKKGNELVRKCLKKSKKEFIILPDPRLPKKHLIENKNIKFAIYPDNKKNWISLAIPIKEKSFKSKKLFPKSWAGFEKEELEKISQRKGALFCHKNRFIIVTKTKDSAIELTKKALKEKD